MTFLTPPPRYTPSNGQKSRSQRQTSLGLHAKGDRSHKLHMFTALADEHQGVRETAVTLSNTGSRLARKDDATDEHPRRDSRPTKPSGSLSEILRARCVSSPRNCVYLAELQVLTQIQEVTCRLAMVISQVTHQCTRR